jgi:hypothetical protein
MSLRRTVGAAFSWPRVAIAEGFAVLLTLLEWLGLEADDKFSRYVAVQIFSRMLAALLVLLAITLAEDAIRRGAPKILSLAIAAVAPSLVSALIFTLLWFDMSWRAEHSVVLYIAEMTMQTALWVSLALIVLDNRAQTALIRESVKQAQMKRVQMERSVLESRLDAVRSQIDGPALFQELNEIRDGLQAGEPRAADALERLIQRLRSSAKGVT